MSEALIYTTYPDQVSLSLSSAAAGSNSSPTTNSFSGFRVQCHVVTVEMGSFRRSRSFAQEDGSGQNGRARASSPPKPSLARVSLLGKILGFLLKRSAGSRSGSGHWRRAFFQFGTCFVIGILIGFTPFMAVDLSGRHQGFSFQDVGAGYAQRKVIASVVDKKLLEDNLDGDTLYAQPPLQESELVARKLLIIVTPTYSRPFQAYHLNRLAHTLRVVPSPLLWIVVEMDRQSPETARILRETGVMYRHLVCDQNATTARNKVVQQRNVALSHIEKCRLDGIVFFVDDDMMYSVHLFDSMREIRRFGTWPVAILAESKNKVWLQGPVCNGSQVVGWHTSPRSKSRRFHVNISGFAFNSTILWDPKRWRRPTSESIRQPDRERDDLQVTAFVEQLVEDENQMEGLPSGCSRVMVWHLDVEAPELIYPNDWLMQKNLEVVAPLT